MIAVAMIAMPLSFMNVIDLGQAAVFIMIAAIVLCVGAMAISLVYGQAGSRVFKNMQTSDRLHVDDDRYWKFGVFYCNPDDASLFLPERFGVGWTLNWGAPCCVGHRRRRFRGDGCFRGRGDASVLGEARATCAGLHAQAGQPRAKSPLKMRH